MEQEQFASQIRTLLASREAQQLKELLSQNGGNTTQNIAKAVQSGDEASAKNLIASLLQDPQISDLLQRMNNHGGD